MIDRAPLVENVRALLSGMSSWIDQASVLDWDGTQGYLPVVRRSMLRRQFESLGVAVSLVEARHGYAAVPLLRPACEELLWLRYLNTLQQASARQLVDHMIGFGLSRDLEAQAAEVGDEEMASLGLSSALAGFRSSAPARLAGLRTLGRELQWPSRVVREGDIPSTWFVAKACRSESLYRFLYHATSRYVHFSAVELARRGWGHPGRLEVSSDVYEPVWASFSLSWGTRLFGFTLSESLEALRSEGVPEPDFGSLQPVLDQIVAVPLIPLVTPDELLWHPSSKTPGAAQQRVAPDEVRDGDGRRGPRR